MLLQHNTLAYFDAIKEDDFPTFGSLAQRWTEEQAMRDYLAQLSGADPTRIIRYTIEGGDKRERVLWHCLLHVVNHGTHRRSAAAAILTG